MDSRFEGVALDAAENVHGESGGIVLRILHADVPADQNIQIHDTDLQVSDYDESEHAIRGIVEGVEVSRDRGPWITSNRARGREVAVLA